MTDLISVTARSIVLENGCEKTAISPCAGGEVERSTRERYADCLGAEA